MDTDLHYSLGQAGVAIVWLVALFLCLARRRRSPAAIRVLRFADLVPLFALILVLAWPSDAGSIAAFLAAMVLVHLGIVRGRYRRQERTVRVEPGKGDYERQIRQLELAFNVRDQVSRAISRETQEDELFQAVCRILVEVGRFHFAWAGWAEGERIRPVAAVLSPALASTAPSLHDSVTVAGRPDSDIFVRGFAATIAQVDNCCKPETALLPWDDPPRFTENLSVAILPVLAISGHRAALVVATRYADAMPDRMLAQFDNLARNISSAVDSYHSAREKERVLHRNRVLSSAVEQSADAICIFETDGAIRYVNSRFRQLTGYDNSQIIGQSPRLLCTSEQDALQFDGIFQDLQQGSRWRGELNKRKRCGEEFRALETIAPLRNEDGEIIRFISTSEDVTALRHAQAKIEELAYFDALTGLANRQLLLLRLREKLEGIEKTDRRAALLVLDLDRFKSLNDALGHEAGDKLLCHAAKRLGKLVREGETAARLGGDEFALLIDSTDSRREVASRAEEILEVMRELVEIDGVAFNGSVSIGVAMAPEDAHEANQLLRHADLAMYRAKKVGRGSYQFFTEDINRITMAEIGLEHQLKTAVREGQLLPHYQPIWDADCKVLGFEALARWPLADGSLVSPADFIPLAEEVGLIEAIGEQILSRACRDIAALSRQLERRLFLAVNLSAMQLRRPDSLLQALQRALDESGLEPQCLELELTESMLVQEVDVALAVLHSLRQLGVRLVIDDFGTGYSSLTYLSQFPVDKLKIDKSFVDAIDSSRGRMITSAIIALGSRLDMRVVAEGVEQQGQRDILAALGCDQFQGFWVARPMPSDQLLDFMAGR